MTLNELLVMQGEATNRLIQRSDYSRLPGMVRELSLGEQRVLSIYEAALMHLNKAGAFKAGAFKEGWLEANPLITETPDSEPTTD